jgi:hypothetical protein
MVMAKKLNNYVCTLPQAKRLKELGVKDDSLFYWIPYTKTIVDEMDYDGNTISSHLENGYEIGICESHANQDCYPAFTSQELGAMISHLCDELRVNWHQTMELKTKIDDYYFWVDGLIVLCSSCNSEAQARAAFLIHLLERKK